MGIYRSRSILCIEDPLNPKNDVAGGSYDALRVKKVFELAFYQLKTALACEKLSSDFRFVLNTIY